MSPQLHCIDSKETKEYIHVRRKVNSLSSKIDSKETKEYIHIRRKAVQLEQQHQCNWSNNISATI
jgi:hypothetical protein